jgi:branched-chain amino acid transport system substrate-binding protein
MVRLRNLLIRVLAPAALCTLAIAACGSQQPPQAKTTKATKSPARNHTVRIYSSLPEQGLERSQTLQIEQGIRLAMPPAKHLVNGFRVIYKALSDSPGPVSRHHGGRESPSTNNRSASGTTTLSPSNSSWSPASTVRNAGRAARDAETVAYIGDLNSGATELSLPILNQAGIVQLTPGSGYPGLTDAYSPKNGIITQPNEPDKYYPQSPRNLLRLIPSDIVQASAALSLLHKSGCQTFAAWQFGGGSEATALLSAVVKTAPLYAMKYVGPPKLPADTRAAYVAYTGTTLKPLNLRCAVLVGHPTAAAELLTTELREQLGTSLPIVGADGFCTSSWVGGIQKAYVKTVAPGLYCMTPVLPLDNREYPGSAGFIAKFRRAYHRRPTAYSYYGYESAEWVLRALHEVAKGDDTRQKVLSGLLQEFVPDKLAPSFTFENGNGDVESNRYGVDLFNAKGSPQHYKTVNVPATDLLPSAG